MYVKNVAADRLSASKVRSIARRVRRVLSISSVVTAGMESNRPGAFHSVQRATRVLKVTVVSHR